MKPLDFVTCPHCDSMNTSYTGEQREEKRDVFYCNFCHNVIYIDWPKGYEPKWRHLPATTKEINMFDDIMIMNVLNTLRDQMSEINDGDFTQLPNFLITVRLRNKLVEHGFNLEMADSVIGNLDIKIDEAFYDTDEKRELVNELVDSLAEMIYNLYEAYQTEFSRWEVFVKMIEGADLKLTVE